MNKRNEFLTSELQRTHAQHHSRKMHLANLPKISDFPDWQGDGKEIALVIPVFSFTEDATHVKSYIAKAAAWSLYTWKLNSDLKKYKAQCFIYVESGPVARAALPILRKYGVTESNIKVAPYDKTAWLGKCVQPIFEKDFSDFEYVCISDIDLFAAAGRDGEPLEFCDKILAAQPKGFGCRVLHESTPGYWIPHIRQLYEYKHNATFAEGVDVVDVWYEAFKELTGQDMRGFWGGAAMDDRPWTGLMVIAKGTFSKEDKDFLSRCCMVFGDDETVIYAWLKRSVDAHMWDVGTIDIPLFLDMLDYMQTAFRRHDAELYKNWIHFDDVFYGKPCLVHHFYSLDYKFYKALGLENL